MDARRWAAAVAVLGAACGPRAGNPAHTVTPTSETTPIDGVPATHAPSWFAQPGVPARAIKGRVAAAGRALVGARVVVTSVLTGC